MEYLDKKQKIEELKHLREVELERQGAAMRKAEEVEANSIR